MVTLLLTQSLAVDYGVQTITFEDGKFFRQKPGSQQKLDVTSGQILDFQNRVKAALKKDTDPKVPGIQAFIAANSGVMADPEGAATVF